MHFLRFLKKESTKPLHKILIIAIISGISNAVLLAIINGAAKGASYDNLNFRYMLMFAITMCLYVVGQKYLLYESHRLIEAILGRIRVRLADKIRKVHLLDLENIGQSAIFDRLTNQLMSISYSAPVIILTLQAVVMLFFLAIYIAILSLMAFALVAVILALGIFHYISNLKKLKSRLEEANQSEMSFFDSLRDSLDGMKENKLNRERSKGLFSFLEKIAEKLRDQKISMELLYADNLIFAGSFYNMLIGVNLFLLPRLSPTFTDVLTQLTAAILFMVGPVGILVGALQTYDQVNFAVSNIYRLEEELAKISEIHEGSPLYEPSLKKVSRFDKIRLKDVRFSYKDSSGNGSFSIGDYTLDIHAGDVVFLVGGNGSGKTTLLKVLSMLYYPGNGEIWLDDTQVRPENAVDYRQLFSSVFSDFHLSSRLYGLEEVKHQKVEELLKLMELDHKTRFLGDRFSTLDLSTGQRKRLALLVALLEDRPIYMFDEWAADQDPEFRQYFYEIMLKDLKDKGKTVIAASHDDRFFKYADRVIKLEYGKIVHDSGQRGSE